MLQLNDGFASSVSSRDAGTESSYFEGIFFPAFFALIQPEREREIDGLVVLESVSGGLRVISAGVLESCISPQDWGMELPVRLEAFPWMHVNFTSLRRAPAIGRIFPSARSSGMGCVSN